MKDEELRNAFNAVQNEKIVAEEGARNEERVKQEAQERFIREVSGLAAGMIERINNLPELVRHEACVALSRSPRWIDKQANHDLVVCDRPATNTLAIAAPVDVHTRSPIYRRREWDDQICLVWVLRSDVLAEGVYWMLCTNRYDQNAESDWLAEQRYSYLTEADAAKQIVNQTSKAVITIREKHEDLSRNLRKEAQQLGIISSVVFAEFKTILDPYLLAAQTTKAGLSIDVIHSSYSGNNEGSYYPLSVHEETTQTLGHSAYALLPPTCSSDIAGSRAGALYAFRCVLPSLRFWRGPIWPIYAFVTPVPNAPGRVAIQWRESKVVVQYIRLVGGERYPQGHHLGLGPADLTPAELAALFPKLLQ